MGGGGIGVSKGVEVEARWYFGSGYRSYGLTVVEAHMGCPAMKKIGFFDSKMHGGVIGCFSCRQAGLEGGISAHWYGANYSTV